MKQYIVDAFTSKPFSGNPAAVCVMDKWPEEDFMMKLAMENNLSETAFIVKEEEGYHLRWFTPGSEVELCGHATLASSFVIFNYFEQNKDVIEFNTLSGKLTIARKGKLAELPGRGQDVTAKGTDTDCVSRSFFPKLLVPEDPVCGSAHCQIADYWSKELGKSEIHAYQASKRGGHLYCTLLENGRIKISGEATLVAISDIVVDF